MKIIKCYLTCTIVICLLLNFIGCSSTSKNTGKAVDYYSPTLHVISAAKTNSKNIDFNIKEGDICKYGEYIGHSNSPDGLAAIGAIFGGNDYYYYIHVKQYEIKNCVVWSSLYTRDNMNIEISAITTSSSSKTIQKSIELSAAAENELANGLLVGGGITYKHSSSSTTTVEFAQGVKESFDINIEGLDTDNYQYAKAILADVEVVRVYKLMQTVEWFQTKTKVTYEYTYTRIGDPTSCRVVLMYKEIDY